MKIKIKILRSFKDKESIADIFNTVGNILETVTNFSHKVSISFNGFAAFFSSCTCGQKSVV